MKLRISLFSSGGKHLGESEVIVRPVSLKKKMNVTHPTMNNNIPISEDRPILCPKNHPLQQVATQVAGYV
jgi:hypothetical protein